MNRLLPFWGLLFLSACTSTPRAKQLILENPLSFTREDESLAIAFSRLGDCRNAMPLLKNEQGEIIPCQFDDLDADGHPDEVAFLCSFAPQQRMTIGLEWIDPSEYPHFASRTNIRYGKVGEDGHIHEQTNDIHGRYGLPRDAATYPYQMDGPAWENDKMGFRHYFDGRNCRDLFGKRTEKMVLDSVGIKPDGKPGDTYHVWADWGRDILSAAQSFGLGGVALRSGEGLTLLGVPAECTTDNVDSTRFTLLFEGPVRSRFTLDFYGWHAAGATIGHLHQEVTIWGGYYGYEQIMTVSELPAGSSLVTGIVASRNSQPYVEHSHEDRLVSMATHDLQSYNKEYYIGMGLILPAENAAGSFHSPEEEGDLRKTWCMALRPDANGRYQYRVCAAWEHRDPRFRDRSYFLDMIDRYAQAINHPILIHIQ